MHVVAEKIKPGFGRHWSHPRPLGDRWQRDRLGLRHRPQADQSQSKAAEHGAQHQRSPFERGVFERITELQNFVIWSGTRRRSRYETSPSKGMLCGDGPHLPKVRNPRSGGRMSRRSGVAR